MTVQDLISSMLRDEGGFQTAFKEILDNELKMSLNEFCQVADISQSTMYKILEERREPNLRTIRQIIKAINRINRRDSEKFVAVIASPRFMEGLPRSLETGASGPSISSIRSPSASTPCPPWRMPSSPPSAQSATTLWV